MRVILPAANEMELHPHFQQPEFFAYLLNKGMSSPSATPPSALREGPSATAPLKTRRPPKIPLSSASPHRLGVHPAVVCIKWAVQRGQIPIPFSSRRANYLANLHGVVGDPLTNEDMLAIAAIDRNCRLIKGQVFLWRDNQSWQDLWDVNGVITPP
jgi:alcohol dehydrogenase (NADP+)